MHVFYSLVQNQISLRIANQHQRHDRAREDDRNQKIRHKRRQSHHQFETERLPHALAVSCSEELRHENAARHTDRIEKDHKDKENLPGDVYP